MEMFFAVLLAVVAADAPVVANPGFEQLSEQTGLPQGWGFTSLPSEAHLVRYETKVGEGQESRALLITLAGDHPAKKVAYVAFQEVPCSAAGKTYCVSAKVRTTGLRTLPMIVVQCVGASKSKYLAFARSPGRALNADIEQWERIETTVQVPDGTATFRLLVGIPSEGNAGGTAMIDDIEVVEASASAAVSSECEQERLHQIPVALLDVAKVFKEARDFNQKMQSVKLAVADFDRNVKAERVEQTDPRDLEAEIKAKKATFLSDEAQAYAETYRAIENAVQRICRERDIGLVIRATTEQIDPKDRGSVLQAVNRPVVYSAAPDLTADVIAALNKGSQ